MQEGNIRIRNEYRHNRRFREYVDKYRLQHGCSVEQALAHAAVKQAYLYYTEV